MFYKRFPLTNNRWPFGKDGDLVVLSGTLTIPSGSVKDYNSVYIAAGAVLKIEGPYQMTFIGSRGPIVVDGSIISNNTGVHNFYNITTTAPDGTSVTSSTGPQSNGGAGGNGYASVAVGGPSFNGRGGGGGGGWTGGGAGGQSGNWGLNDITLGHGADGVDTSNGYGTAATNGGGGGGGRGFGRGAAGTGSDQGGGGAGGGYPGKHSLPLFIKSKHSIKGTGVIQLTGGTGFNGGIGGLGSGTKGTGGTGGGGGGGGGGGAGGNGGNMFIYSKGFYVEARNEGGTGGNGGSGGSGYSGWSGASGSNGSDGFDGYLIITNIV